MYRGNGGSQFGGEQYMEYAQKVLNWVTRRGAAFWLLLVAVAVVFWLATGIYTVSAREQGVVRLFGSFNSLAQPGLNWRLPSPITSLVKVDVETIRTTEIGFRSDETGRAARLPSEALMLTTDNSIVEAQMVIQYRVGNAKDFVFNVADPEEVLHTAGEVALRSIVGRLPLLTVLTIRPTVERESRIFLEDLLARYQTGIEITDMKLQVTDPPEQVKPAFQEVTRALEDETRLQNEADAFQADQLPRAQGQVQVRIRAAAAFNRQRIEESRGAGNRFLAILEEYRGAPKVTRENLYLITLEEVLGTVDKLLIDPEVDILPLLNLSGVNEGFLQDAVIEPQQGQSDE